MIYENNYFIISFKLQKNTIMDIYSEDNLQAITHYSYSTVIFNQNNQTYTISREFPLHLFLSILQKLLKKSLHNNLQLNPSINHDIGYLWNEWINNNHTSLLYITDKNNETSWVGQQYQLSSDDYLSWIYNDEKQNIIFELTPAYPLGCIDQENEQEIKNYRKWIQSYTPLFKDIIPYHIAQEWIIQTEQILDIIDKNSEKLYPQQ